MSKDKTLSTDLINALENAIKEAGVHDEAIVALGSTESTQRDRKVAARSIAARILHNILPRATGIEHGVKIGEPNLVAADIVLRYLKFIVYIDQAYDSSDVTEQDPIDLLVKLTGLGRDKILSLYQKTSASKFMEVSTRTTISLSDTKDRNGVDVELLAEDANWEENGGNNE